MGDDKKPVEKLASDVVRKDAATTTGRPGKAPEEHWTTPLPPAEKPQTGFHLPRWLWIVGGLIALVMLVLAVRVLSAPGGGGAPLVTPAPAPSAASSPIATTAPPPSAATPIAPPPTTVTMGGSYVHTNPGVSSTVCGTTKTSPALVGAPVTTRIATSDGAVSGPVTVSGTTDATGSTKATFTITKFGSYTLTSTVTSPDGTTKTATQTVNVTAAPGGGC